MIPFFSIIIPLYNKENYIESTLKSVLNQSYENFEIIVVNDGSTDNSLQFVKNFENKKIKIVNQQNKGVSTARNNGIKSAKGNYIALLDADDYWYPNHLQSFVDSILKFKNESIFCNNYEIETVKNNIKPASFYFQQNIDNIFVIKNYFKASLQSSIAWTSSMCIKKEVFKSNFWFDEQIKSSQDTDLWIRLGLNYNFVFNKNISARHLKFIENSLSKSKNLESRLQTLEKYTKEEENHFYLKKFMDNNRFSIAVEAKLLNENEIFRNIINNIDFNNLNKKQKLILKLPKEIVILLKNIKLLLAKVKINTTVFR